MQMHVHVDIENKIHASAYMIGKSIQKKIEFIYRPRQAWNESLASIYRLNDTQIDTGYKKTEFQTNVRSLCKNKNQTKVAHEQRDDHNYTSNLKLAACVNIKIGPRHMHANNQNLNQTCAYNNQDYVSHMYMWMGKTRTR